MIIRDLSNMEKGKCNRVLIEKHPELQTRLDGVEITKRITARRRSSLLFFYISMLSIMICFTTIMILKGASTIAVVVYLVLMIALLGIGHWFYKRTMAKYTEESLQHEANLEQLLRDHPYLEKEAQDKNVQAILEEVVYFEKRYSSEKRSRRREIVSSTYFTLFPPYHLIIHILVLNGVLGKDSGLTITLACIPHLMYFFSFFFV